MVAKNTKRFKNISNFWALFLGMKIFLIITALFITPTAIYKFLSGKELPTDLLPNLILIKYFLIFVMTFVFLRKGVHIKAAERFFRNERSKREKRAQEIKNRYELRSLMTGENPGEFILSLNSIIIKTQFIDTTPHLTINGVPVKINHIKDDKIFFFCRNFSATDDKIVISIEGKSWNFKNPFKLELDSECVSWQVKGHTDELYVYIKKSGVPNALPNLEYSFDIKINRETFGPFSGKLNTETDIIAIKIPRIPKNCEANKCFLVARYDRNYSFLLPKPKMILVNGVQK